MNGACGWFCGTFYTKSSRRLRKTKKTILPPQAVPLPLQGRLNVSLRDSTHLTSLIREENIFIDTFYPLFITHHSLIFSDTDFSRFTSHFSLNAAGFDTDFASCYLPNKQLQKRRAKENYSNNYRNNRGKHHRSS